MEYLKVYFAAAPVRRARGDPPMVSLLQLRNTTGVCGANAAAQCYAAIVYHRLWQITGEEQSALRAELEKTRYGRLLLAMLSGLMTEHFDSGATWQCTAGKNDASRSTIYFLFVAEEIPAVKRLLQMHFVQTSSMYDETQPIKTDTDFLTHLGFFVACEGGETLMDFIHKIIAAPSGWTYLDKSEHHYGVLSDVTVEHAPDGSLDVSEYTFDLKNYQFMGVPKYITVYVSPRCSTTFTVTPLSGKYVINGLNNPILTVHRGTTYTFTINARNHPFCFQTAPGAYDLGQTYSDGVTNGGVDVGTITWRVAEDAPATLYYACKYHSTMLGQINVLTSPRAETAPVLFSLTERSGAVHGYNLLAAMVLKKDAQKYADSLAHANHATAICRYHDAYYEFDDARVRQVFPDAAHVISARTAASGLGGDEYAWYSFDILIYSLESRLP